ncbi:hypothetical protein T492DRAFT_906526, partial [Pavlovales sp. CCMP2436]
MAEVVTVAGSYRIGVEDGAGGAASFNTPHELLTLPDGSLLVADTAGNRIRRVRRLPGSDGFALPASACVETVHAKGWLRPMGMCLLPDGSVLVCDSGHNKIRRLSPDLAQVTAFAGSGLRGSRDGPADSAQFDGPRGICVWRDAVLITDGHAIRALVSTPGGSYVNTIAGKSQEGGYLDGRGAAARFRSPSALLQYAGSVLVCDTGNHCIRHLILTSAEEYLGASAAEFAPSATVLTLCGRPVSGLVDGGLHLALFHSPSGLAALPNAREETVTTIAGSLARKYGQRNGPAELSLLNLPRGLALGGNNLGGKTSECVFIADSANNCIRAVVPRSRTVVRVQPGSEGTRGAGSDGFGGDARAGKNPGWAGSPKRPPRRRSPPPSLKKTELGAVGSVSAATVGLPLFRPTAAAAAGVAAASRGPRLSLSPQRPSTRESSNRDLAPAARPFTARSNDSCRSAGLRGDSRPQPGADGTRRAGSAGCRGDAQGGFSAATLLHASESADFQNGELDRDAAFKKQIANGTTTRSPTRAGSSRPASLPPGLSRSLPSSDAARAALRRGLGARAAGLVRAQPGSEGTRAAGFGGDAAGLVWAQPGSEGTRAGAAGFGGDAAALGGDAVAAQPFPPLPSFPSSGSHQFTPSPLPSTPRPAWPAHH